MAYCLASHHRISTSAEIFVVTTSPPNRRPGITFPQAGTTGWACLSMSLPEQTKQDTQSRRGHMERVGRRRSIAGTPTHLSANVPNKLLRRGSTDRRCAPRSATSSKSSSSISSHATMSRCTRWASRTTKTTRAVCTPIRHRQEVNLRPLLEAPYPQEAAFFTSGLCLRPVRLRNRTLSSSGHIIPTSPRPTISTLVLSDLWSSILAARWTRRSHRIENSSSSIRILTKPWASWPWRMPRNGEARMRRAAAAARRCLRSTWATETTPSGTRKSPTCPQPCSAAPRRQLFTPSTASATPTTRCSRCVSTTRWSGTSTPSAWLRTSSICTATTSSTMGNILRARVWTMGICSHCRWMRRVRASGSLFVMSITIWRMGWWIIIAFIRREVVRCRSWVACDPIIHVLRFSAGTVFCYFSACAFSRRDEVWAGLWIKHAREVSNRFPG